MKVLLDTNVYSHALRGEDACSELVRSADSLVLSPVVVGELLFGFRNGKKETKNREQFSSFLESPRVSVVPITENTSEYFALILSQLKEDGSPIPSNDAWIAASAMEHGLSLATLDSHFQNIKGLLLWK